MMQEVLDRQKALVHGSCSMEEAFLSYKIFAPTILAVGVALAAVVIGSCGLTGRISPVVTNRCMLAFGVVEVALFLSIRRVRCEIVDKTAYDRGYAEGLRMGQPRPGDMMRRYIDDDWDLGSDDDQEIAWPPRPLG